jgi:hypothetical protein
MEQSQQRTGLPAVPRFSLAPGADYTTILDFDTATGRLPSVIETVPLDPKDNGKPAGLQESFHAMGAKAKEHGWGAHRIKITLAGTNLAREPLVEHGQSKLSHAQAQTTQDMCRPTDTAQAAAQPQPFLSKSFDPSSIRAEDGPAMLNLLRCSGCTRATGACLHAKMQIFQPEWWGTNQAVRSSTHT